MTIDIVLTENLVRELSGSGPTARLTRRRLVDPCVPDIPRGTGEVERPGRSLRRCGDAASVGELRALRHPAARQVPRVIRRQTCSSPSAARPRATRSRTASGVATSTPCRRPAATTAWSGLSGGLPRPCELHGLASSWGSQTYSLSMLRAKPGIPSCAGSAGHLRSRRRLAPPSRRGASFAAPFVRTDRAPDSSSDPQSVKCAAGAEPLFF